MADFYVCCYSKTLEAIWPAWERLNRDYPSNHFELWAIEPDRYGNRFIVIDRKKQRGRKPTLVFLKRVA